MSKTERLIRRLCKKPFWWTRIRIITSPDREPKARSRVERAYAWLKTHMGFRKGEN